MTGAKRGRYSDPMRGHHKILCCTLLAACTTDLTLPGGAFVRLREHCRLP